MDVIIQNHQGLPQEVENSRSNLEGGGETGVKFRGA